MHRSRFESLMNDGLARSVARFASARALRRANRSSCLDWDGSPAVPVDGSTGCNGGVRSRLLVCGVTGPMLFVASFLVQGALRPDYDALRHPVSSLSLGPSGWVQMATFWLTGLLIAAYAIGLRRAGCGWWTPVLVGLVGVGLVGAGIFVPDPISGYPPGSPMSAPPTRHGLAHQLFSTPVFTALPAAMLVMTPDGSSGPASVDGPGAPC